MTLTLNDILNITPVLRKLAGQPFPGKMVFRIAKLIKACENELACFEEARKGVIDRYGARKDDGELDITEDNQIRIQPEKIEDCNREMMELLSNEVEMDFEPLPLSCFDNVELTPNEVIMLEKIIEE